MVRRTHVPEGRGDPSPTVVGVEALDHLARLTSLLDFLLEGRSGQPAPLDAWLVCGGSWPSALGATGWNRIVGAALLTGEMLDRALPDTPETEGPRRDLGFLRRLLQDQVEETLRDLRRWWPRLRVELRQFVLAHVCTDDPEDLRPIDGALRACGVAELPGPAPHMATTALRSLLAELMLQAGTDATRTALRDVLWKVAGIRTPRRARHVLACSLAQRVPENEEPRIEEHAFLGDQAQPAPLAVGLVQGAVLLLAMTDVLAAGGTPGLLRFRSAYGVLRRSGPREHRSDELRAAVETVIEGRSDPDAVAQVVSAVLGATQPFGGSAGPARVTAHGPVGPSVADPVGPAHAAAGQASPGEGGAAERGRVSSPAPATAWVARVHADGRASTPSVGGDGTETSKAPFHAGPPEVSSPAAPGAPDTRDERVGNTSTGGDGTETSGAQIPAGPSEVSSPAGPARAAVRPRPEDLALAFLTHELRHGHPVPSLAKCAGVAGVTKQATANWSDFMLVWRNAKAARGGRIRRGYRSARTGDIEAESGDG